MAIKREPAPAHQTRRQVLKIATAGAAAAAAGGLTGMKTLPASAGVPKPTLTGSWFAQYKRTPGSQLWGIWTYNEDGTLVTTGSDQPTRTPSLGHWMSLGGNQFASNVVGIDLDSAGNFAGTTEVDTDVTLDPSGNIQHNMSRVRVYDATGNLLSSVASAATAWRLPLVRRSDPIPPAMHTQDPDMPAGDKG